MELVGLRHLPRVFQRALILIAIAIAFAVTLAMLPAQAFGQDLSKPTFVVATASQDAGHYSRTVLLAIPYQTGHIGVILNRPTQLKMGEIFKDSEPSQRVVEPVYFGGPQNMTWILALAKGEKPGEKSIEVDAGIWFVGRADEIDAVLEKTPNAARYFNGLVVWEEGELKDEILRGWMVTRPLKPALLFMPDTSKLYDMLIGDGKPKLET